MSKPVPPMEVTTISRVVDLRISIEMYYILWTIFNKEFDKYEQYIDNHPIGSEVIQYLHREGLIETDDPDYSIESLMLTDISLDMFVSDDSSVDSWITEWRDLWPKGVTSGGYPVRADLPSITKKMKAFIKKYKKDKETIFRVTKDYLKDKQVQGWSYVKTAA